MEAGQTQLTMRDVIYERLLMVKLIINPYSRCKKSARKHKKWEGDAILTVRHDARLAILKDMVTLPQ